MTDESARQLRHPLRCLVAVVLVAVAVFTTAACGDDEKDGGTSSGAEGTEITIKDFTYSPNPLEAKVGDTITVKNDDGSAHTLTADDDSVDTGNIAGGASGTVEMEKAGTLAYHCNIHGNTMAGTIEVSA
jgi:plastocyanin